jgi:pimeloyl-ACP methyl ester carboxylesterase
VARGLVVVQEVGHALFVDEADQFNSLLEEFLKRVGG